MTYSAMNKNKNVNNRKVHKELINTWETYDKIIAQYSDEDNDLSDECMAMLKYIDSLDEFNRKVFYLYAEYGSYRKVAEETNRGKDVVMQVIRDIQIDIKSGKYIK